MGIIDGAGRYSHTIGIYFSSKVTYKSTILIVDGEKVGEDLLEDWFIDGCFELNGLEVSVTPFLQADTCLGKDKVISGICAL